MTFKPYVNRPWVVSASDGHVVYCDDVVVAFYTDIPCAFEAVVTHNKALEERVRKDQELFDKQNSVPIVGSRYEELKDKTPMGTPVATPDQVAFGSPVGLYKALQTPCCDRCNKRLDVPGDAESFSKDGICWTCRRAELVRTIVPPAPPPPVTLEECRNVCDGNKAEADVLLRWVGRLELLGFVRR